MYTPRMAKGKHLSPFTFKATRADAPAAPAEPGAAPAAPADAPKGDGKKGRVLRFLGATEKVARDGGILTIDGWDVEAYKANPVFLYAHDHAGLPIGRTLNVERGPEGLTFDVEFASAEVYPFADLVGRLYEAGFMRAVSVGFRVKQERNPTPEERGAGASWVSTAHELLELSAVPVGADANALVAARSAFAKADAPLLRRIGLDAFTRLADALEGREATDAERKPVPPPPPPPPGDDEEPDPADPKEGEEPTDEEKAADMEGRLTAIAERLEALADRIEQRLNGGEPKPAGEDTSTDAGDGGASGHSSHAPAERGAPTDPFGILELARSYAGRTPGE